MSGRKEAEAEGNRGGREALILHGLNPVQREAVCHSGGPLLIFAGAGSGKTRVLTHRVAYLIQHCGVPPEQILAVTFTNKAADEMKGRIVRLVGRARWDIWVGTFHSICARMLRANAAEAGLERNFVVFDESDQMTLMKACLAALEVNPELYPPGKVLAEIGHAKNELVSWRDYEQTAQTLFQQTVARLYRRYQEQLRANSALDFDDLIMLCVRLFEDHREVLEAYQQRFLHLLVDEYQDINFAQYRWVRLLAAAHRNLCVVGDDDQAIYGWRGADMRIILRFEQDYPQAHIVRLEQNYRSTQNILDAAWQVIRRNRERREKRLWTEAPAGEKIGCFEATDEHQEAVFVAHQLEALMRDRALESGRHLGYGDFAVLYRTNAQSRVFEKVFISLGVPYRIVGGLRFYDRAEIKNVLAYLRLLANPADSVSLKRIINIPPRGIGQVTLSRLEQAALQRRMSLLEAVQHAEAIEGIGPRARQALADFAALLERLRRKAQRASVTELVEAVAEDSGYRFALEQEKTLRAQAQLDNIRELSSATREYEEQNEEGGLQGFLENVALLTSQDELAEGLEAVPLLTLHSAKGLEFPVVFMVGLEEGLFPIMRAVGGDERELEEERRLCYVGMTRAQRKLFLTWATQRTLFGTTNYTRPSRFLEDVPPELLDGVPRMTSPRTITWRGADSQAATGAAASAPPRPDGAFRAGDMVRHEQFGRGIVISVEGKQGSERLSIAFEGVGVKKLAAEHAKLERV